MKRQKPKHRGRAATAPIEPYVGLAQKYRPRRFADLVGQPDVARILSGAFKSGRLPRAVLLYGPTGVGKTTTARIISAAYNCQRVSRPTATPCGECEVCGPVFAGQAFWGNEYNAAIMSGADAISAILHDIMYVPMYRFCVCLLDEVQNFSGRAFDRLLRVLEEPPPHVAFVLCTTAPNKVPRPIWGRCLKLRLRRLSVAELTSHLEAIAKKDGASMDPEALRLIAESSGGQVRDALNALEAALAFDGVQRGA